MGNNTFHLHSSPMQNQCQSNVQSPARKRGCLTSQAQGGL